ncbi:MAG: DsbA family protein [Caulobacteraceae bacterium]|nr:DsbA family protein [Caulobacteraceae bacterium]
MRFPTRRSAALVGLALGLILASAASAAPDWRVTPDDMTLGSPDAKVTVIEYASASCPHCAQFNNEVFADFKARYVDTGKVRYVMRELLTPPLQVAAAGFLTARCGGKDKYFPILDQIFRHQQEIYEKGDVQGVMLRAGQSAGLTEAQVNACVFDGAGLSALNTRVQTYAARDGINSTPTFVINGQVLSGEQTLATLGAAVDTASKAR